MSRPHDDYSADFHDFGGAVYLNCAYHGAMPRVATGAVREALRLKETPHRIRDMDHFDYADAFRGAVARLIGAEERDVAVTDSATRGVMILVAGLDWKPGDEVVLPAGEFPANRFPWLSLEADGVVVREVPVGPGPEAVDELAGAISGRTRVVAASWVSYSTGRRLDVDRLGAACRDAGVLLAVDGSQGIGGLPFSVRETPCDLLTCAAYKWTLGPYGVGFAWVRPGLADELRPANVNWFSLEGARNFNRLSECRLEYVPGARRFDANEPGNFFNMAGAAAATEYVAEVGPAAVEAHVAGLFDRLVDGLPDWLRPVETHPSQRSNILCLALDPDVRGDALLARLREADVYLSQRQDSLRISPHVYNTPGDVDRLLEALEAAVG